MAWKWLKRCRETRDAEPRGKSFWGGFHYNILIREMAVIESHDLTLHGARFVNHTDDESVCKRDSRNRAVASFGRCILEKMSSISVGGYWGLLR